MANFYDKHKCIFCFRPLSNTDICFETVDDTVEMVSDPVKVAYERHFDSSVDENDVRCLSRRPIRDYTIGDAEFDLDFETGIPVAWNESKNGWSLKSNRRLCRFCHNPLPSSFGKHPNITIGLCGNSAAGKTVYMLSLIHELQRLKGMSATPDPVFYSQMSTRYDTMYEAMYSSIGGFQLPVATNPNDMLSPLVLNCTYGLNGNVKKFSITVFDMAGEGMKNPSYMAKQAVYLQNAVGVIYLKNPDYFPGMRKENEALLEHAYLQPLFDTINQRSPDAGKAYLAITMTKFDLLLNRYEGNPEFDRMRLGDLFRGDPVSHHNDGFDIGQAIRVNRRMYDLYDWENTKDQTIRSLYDSQKKSEEPVYRENKKRGLFGWGKKKEEEAPERKIKQWVMLFAASPLGRNVQFMGDNDLAMAPSGMLNIDPLLWLLYSCDVFPAKIMNNN